MTNNDKLKTIKERLMTIQSNSNGLFSREFSSAEWIYRKGQADMAKAITRDIIKIIDENKSEA